MTDYLLDKIVTKTLEVRFRRVMWVDRDGDQRDDLMVSMDADDGTHFALIIDDLDNDGEGATGKGYVNASVLNLFDDEDGGVQE